MPVFSAALRRLAAIPELSVRENAPLSEFTRFGIGGPAALLGDTNSEPAFIEAMGAVQDMGLRRMVIGGGTNLVVADSGFEGVVLRYTGSKITRIGNTLHAEAGAVLQDVVDQSIAFGLKGMQTMTGIPGYLGGAIYGNAGAYGHSIQERVRQVQFFDGEQTVCFDNEACQFRYRESAFKQHKEWVILSCELEFESGPPEELAKTADEIRAIRDAKYPPAMKCAGSIFKNLLIVNLPAPVVTQIPAKAIREGKVASAWFLEQTGARGMRRGDIQVAPYHANLVYNDGAGTSADLVAVIEELKHRVYDRFGIELEEEVQYVGFDYVTAPA
ncbi:MAG: UDP-N-acetylmuramate dehydrogenase [Acidobacteriaceae bacterium]|nr:UDP-N-acetylmuramate dehydrogenase [Acidobacteriaceae bacterium]